MSKGAKTMNMMQIRIAFEAAKLGSISAAAEKLFVSQPSASNNIRALEKELGYELFLRSNTGATPTDAGKQFLEHARIILDELEQAEAIGSGERAVKLRLGCFSYSPMTDAFIRFCAETGGNKNAVLSCVNVPLVDGVKQLTGGDMDAMFVLLSPLEVENVHSLVLNRGLTMQLICEIPMNINLREGHPLLKDGRFDYAGLADYPFVGYAQIPNIIEYASGIADYRIPCCNRIIVNESDTRCRLVSTTDAFSIGCSLTRTAMRHYGIRSIRISEMCTVLYCICRPGQTEQPELKRYIELLHEELQEI